MFDTREGWLVDAVKHIERDIINKQGCHMPEKWGVSCGFPRGSRTATGQCWDPAVSADGTTHIFICPSVDDEMEVLGILTHEMIHASVGIEHKHGGRFKKVARGAGLVGKLTATDVEEDTELHMQLTAIAVMLGAYPHAKIHKSGSGRGKGGGGGEGEGEGKAKGKYMKLVSVSDPEFKVFISPKVLAERGSPMDPDGKTMVEE